MGRVLVARPVSPWQRVGKAAVTVLAISAQVALGLLVLALRTVRVAVTVVTAAALVAEQQLAESTGRRALSDTGIAALASAFIYELRTAYHQPTR